MLQSEGAQQMVEAYSSETYINNIIFVPAVAATNFTCVALYYDDYGSLKGFDVNRRASEICSQVLQPTTIIGDAWIGSYYDDENVFLRHNFTLRDLHAPEWRLQVCSHPHPPSASSIPQYYGSVVCTPTVYGSVVCTLT
uniref:Auxin response factor 8 n=1 Tax=Lygus hesperus TaxID=30085 RepID=A0A0A9ZAT5_LYGHE